mgnify:CR=1 FL=1
MNKSKIILILTIWVVTFFILIPKLSAKILVTATVNSDNGINVRSGAGTGYGILGAIQNGSEISLQSTTKYSGTGCSKGWYKITYNNKTGYVCSNYVTNVQSIDTNNVYVENDWIARVNATDGLGFRATASTSGTRLGTLTYGVNVTILSEAAAGNGCSGKWYKIKYNNKTGYACSDYIIKKANVTSSSTKYDSTWKSAGFPESYWPYLTYLKTKYPNWTFTAVKTNTNFTDAILAEYGANSIQSTDNAVTTSTSQVETGGWYNVRHEAIAFYLDPRNFLNEKAIFVYENNNYNSAIHTSAVVTSTFNGGTNKKYASSFVTAGKSKSISPVHLATRSIQEVGRNGNDATKGPYYNFFNIGAYSSCSNPLQCGIDYAKSKGWNTPVKAITAGADLIKTNYYNNNQKTRYFEKFNVINAKYNNQYMTNIQAPLTEGANAYSNYVSNKVQSKAINFIIPVFNNMPEYTSLPGSQNTDATLSSIKIDGTTISGFDKDVVEYVLPSVPSTKTSINITATTSKSTSKVTGTGVKTLKSGLNTFTLTVTAQAGNTETYTIKVNKLTTENESDLTADTIAVSAGGKLNNSYLSGFTPGITALILKNTFKQISSIVNTTINTSSGKAKSDSEKIKTGDKVTITNSKSTRTYTLVVKGDNNGDGIINTVDLVYIRKVIKNSNALNALYKEASDINRDGKINTVDLVYIRKHIAGDSVIK